MSKIKEVLILHHSHLDVGYTHAQPIILELHKDYIDQALALCEQTEAWPEHCKFRWTCESSSVVLRWLETADHIQKEKLHRYLNNGQMSISASFMHTTPLCNAEQLAHMLLPIKQLRNQFGIEIKTAIHHDINGQPWPYSQLLLDAGVEFLIMGINIHFGGFPLTRPMAFHWQAPDRRKLLAFNGEQYSLFPQLCNLYDKDTSGIKDGLAKYIAKIDALPDYPFDFVYMTSTNLPLYDNNPPDAELASLFRKWNGEGHEYMISFVTPEQLLARIKKQEHQLSVYAGDWTDYWNCGSGSSAKEVRLNRKTKQGMKAVELLGAFQPEHDAAYVSVKKQAWEQINLFDEHTWGAFNSVTDPDKLDVSIQWMHKAHYAYQANSLTGYLLGTKMEKFARNPHQSGTPEGLMLINPSAAPQIHEIRFTAAYQEGEKHLAANRMRFVPMNREQVRSGAAYGTVHMEPFSWRMIPFDSIKKAEVAEDISFGEDWIETPFHRCTFDPLTGRIQELFDKKLNWNVLDSSSPYTFFQYVQETIDPAFHHEHRSTFFPTDIPKALESISVWNHDWKAKRSTMSKLNQCLVERGVNSITLIIRAEAPGVTDFEQRITFFNYKSDIELKASFHKQDITTPEGTYFAFPLNLDQWQCHYDTAGQVVELDKEQLPGVCRDYITVDKHVSLYDGNKGITLACPDAPLVQIGGFHFGKEQKEVLRESNPLLLAWPMNNYWDTNFRAHQPGPVSFTYVFSTFKNYDEMQAMMAGTRATAPILSAPVVHCSEERTGQWLECISDGVIPFDIKHAEDGNGIIVRLVNLKHHSVEVKLRVPNQSITAAIITNVLEEGQEEINRSQLHSDGGLHLTLGSKQMLHLRLQLLGL
ncbi:glycosyl hydrolase-related protein [Cohnella silvisoli]|uniref:Glycosyl hydrolase-related protein n=1 Tax=Cohnella silvisoli TaxID=2873699 RepID=A0ABV1KVI2_9BACL|nr:glycosyl hydrolase-related protein [Cohnella silvisoli]MCD9023511.1 hypothetical protein [Cohnella silvisoli]